MSGGGRNGRSFPGRVLRVFPEALIGIPFLIWLIFSAGIGVGAALAGGGIAIGWGVFLLFAVALPALFILIATFGFGD